VLITLVVRERSALLMPTTIVAMPGNIAE